VGVCLHWNGLERETSALAAPAELQAVDEDSLSDVEKKDVSAGNGAKSKGRASATRKKSA
jgi:hypothetical protein